MSKNRFKIRKRCKVEGCNKLVTADDHGVCKFHICRCHMSCCKVHEKKDTSSKQEGNKNGM